MKLEKYHGSRTSCTSSILVKSFLYAYLFGDLFLKTFLSVFWDVHGLHGKNVRKAKTYCKLSTTGGNVMDHLDPDSETLDILTESFD